MQANEPAYPVEVGLCHPGLTKREHAAILLRVPMSGDADIDAMIKAANRRDLTIAAFQSVLISHDNDDVSLETRMMVGDYADALLTELAKEQT